MKSNPAGRLDLHILIEKEGDLYSVLCLELNVASQGETLEEARKNIREAIEIYLEDVYESDEKEFIPRPAPVEEWIKYFKQKAQEIRDRILEENVLNLTEAVVG